MGRRLFGLLLGSVLMLGSTSAFGQCGSNIKRTFQTCGSHCGTVEVQSCQGVGTFCQDNTGPRGEGCCGLIILLPGGGCHLGQQLRPGDAFPSPELIAFREAVAVRRELFPRLGDLTVASCGPDQNAFSRWLETKLAHQQDRR